MLASQSRPMTMSRIAWTQIAVPLNAAYATTCRTIILAPETAAPLMSGTA